MNRDPTTEESARWNTFFTNVTRKTLKHSNGCLALGELGVKLRLFITNNLQITNIPYPIDDGDIVILKDIQNRSIIMNRLVDKVLTKEYAVSFFSGTLDIVAIPGTDPESVQQDIYPSEIQSVGIAPIVIVAGIAALTLLIAGDQAADNLDKQAKIEALRLQQKMLETDKAMATADPSSKASYDAWKKQNAATFGKAMENLSGDAKSPGFIERFLGTAPTMALIVGALVIGGLAVAFRRKGG